MDWAAKIRIGGSEMRLLWMVFIATTLFPFSASGLNNRQEVMLHTLGQVHDIYFQHYAPLLWKNDQKPNLIQTKFSEVLQAVKSEPDMTKDRFRELLYQALAATRDYHVNISFYSTETSVLPFSVRTAEKRVFVGYVNPMTTKDDPAYNNVVPGTEILEWKGRPAFSVIEELMNRAEINTPGTDLRFAEMFLTNRIRAYRLPIEKGTFLVKFKGPGGEFVRALTWKYTEESIPQETPIEESLLQKASFRSQSQSLTRLFSAYAADVVAMEDLREDILSADNSKKIKAEPPPNPHRVGGRTSYVPRLGTIIWENDKKNPFLSYIYKNEAGRLIGYLRIPSYEFALSKMSTKQDIKNLEDNLKTLEDKTDALVLDQVSNPGGNLFFTYALISRLISEPAFALPHQLVLSGKDGMEAFKMQQELKGKPVPPDDEQEDDDDESIAGLVVGNSFKYGMADYAKFVLEELRKGHHLTDPYPMLGISEINPNPDIRYTKPIVMLIDHADISGGDFTPAMLKDANRVTLLGSRTSGAGGYIRTVQFPNQFDIASVTFTASKAIRKNGKPLENLGVEPDITYELTAEDLQKGFKPYRAAINKAINDVLTKESDRSQQKEVPSPATETKATKDI